MQEDKSQTLVWGMGLMLVASSPVLKAESPPASVSLPPVVIVSRGEPPADSLNSASQGEVRAERLLDRPISRPAEILETVPGLVVTQHSGEGKANQYFLRGFNLDHGTDFATRVDGVPVNMPTHAHGQGYVDLNFLIPELVQKVEYRKGPYDASQGDFSAVGSADIAYRQSLSAPWSQITTGGHGYRRMVGAHSTVLTSGATLLSALEVTAHEGPWTEPERLRRTNAVVKLADGSASSGWSLGFMTYHARWNATDQIPERLIQSGSYQGRPFGRLDAIDPSDGGQTARTSLSAQWQGTDSDGTTKVAAYALRYRLSLSSNFTYLMDRPDTGDQFTQQDARNAYGLSVARSVSHRLGGRAAVSDFGVQSRLDRIHVGLFDSQERVVFNTVRMDQVTQAQVGVYGQTSIQWRPHLRTVVGLRADSLRANVSSAQQALNAGVASQALLSPKFSLAWGPWHQTTLFFNAGQGFHSNDTRGMTATVDPRNGSATQSVSGMAKARGAEVGLRTEVVPGLQSSVALWRLDFGSELVFSGDEGTTSPKGASHRYGVEWSNRWTPRPGLQFDWDASWSRARFRQAESDGFSLGTYIPNAIDKVATVSVTFKNLGPWRANWTARYVGSGALTTDNQVRSSASLLSSLRISRNLGTQSTLTFDVLNLFNRRYNDIEYFYASQLAGEAAPVYGKAVHAGEPRTIRATWRMRFV